MHRKPILYLSLCFLFCFVSSTFKPILVTTSPLRKLIFSIFWPDQFLSSFLKNRHQSWSILESFSQKTMSYSTLIWWNKPFPLPVALGCCVYPSHRKQTTALIVLSLNCKRSCRHQPSGVQARTFVSIHLGVYLPFWKYVYTSYYTLYDSIKLYISKLSKWKIKNYFFYEN